MIVASGENISTRNHSPFVRTRHSPSAQSKPLVTIATIATVEVNLGSPVMAVRSRAFACLDDLAQTAPPIVYPAGKYVITTPGPTTVTFTATSVTFSWEAPESPPAASASLAGPGPGSNSTGSQAAGAADRGDALCDPAC